MKTELKVIQSIESMLPVKMTEFEAVCVDDKINFAKEAGFALQLLGANKFLGDTARNNAQSLRDAILNVAAIGTTLNPAEKKAYLVPRKGVVCLDLSYRGLADLAVESGACEWIDAKLVYANDDYQSGGIGEKPEHKPANPFKGQRGEMVGVYAVAKRKDGSYAVREMDMQQINAIKARSESGKRGNGPWKTDFNEMALKTPVKSVVKMLQGTSKRIDSAISMLNNQGEGIDFNSEQRANPRDINCSQNAQSQISELLSACAMEIQDVPASAVGRTSPVYAAEELSELEAGQLIAMLRIRANKMGQTK